MGLKLIDAVGNSALPAKLRPVAMVYARKANDDGTLCFPSVPWVAAYLDLQPRIVSRHRDALIDLGILTFKITTINGTRRHRVIVAFRADKLPPKVGTTVPKVGTVVPTSEPKVGTTVLRVGPTVPTSKNVVGAVKGVRSTASPASSTTIFCPTSLSTSQEKSTSQVLASIDNAPDGALVSAPSSPRTDPAIKRCFSAYHDAYIRRFGNKPLIFGGKDAALIKKLLAAWGERDVLACIELFFTTTDPRVQTTGFTVGAFFSEAQRLRVQERQPVRDARTLGNLDAAARACGRR